MHLLDNMEVRDLVKFWRQDPAQVVSLAREEYGTIRPDLLLDLEKEIQHLRAEIQTGRKSILTLKAIYCISLLRTLRLVVTHHGEPSVPSELREQAPSILSGERPSALALQLDNGCLALTGDADDMLLRLHRLRVNTAPYLTHMGFATAALAVSAQQLMSAVIANGVSAQDSITRTLRHIHRIAPGDPINAERILLDALGQAARTGNPDDEAEVLIQFHYVSLNVPISDAAMRVALKRTIELIQGGQSSRKLIHILQWFMLGLRAHGWSQDFGAILASSGELLLKSELPPQERVPLALATATAWKFVGRLDRADLLLWKLREEQIDHSQQLQLAQAPGHALEFTPGLYRAFTHRFRLDPYGPLGSGSGALKTKFYLLTPDGRAYRTLSQYDILFHTQATLDFSWAQREDPENTGIYTVYDAKLQIRLGPEPELIDARVLGPEAIEIYGKRYRRVQMDAHANLSR